MNDDVDPMPVPEVDALLAGTPAAMTTWADPCTNCRMDAQTQRVLLARKVVSNLFLLQQHPAVSAALRSVIAKARERWLGVAHGAPALQATAHGGGGQLH